MAFIIGTSTANTQILAAGTTAERPGSPSAGQLRFNSTTGGFEGYAGTSWAVLGSTNSFPPVTSGLIGFYIPENYNNGVWVDTSGSVNSASTIRGTINKSSHTGNSFGANNTFTVLSGDLNAGLQFPSTILPATYTLFHVARYNLAIGTGGGDGAGRGRIFDGVSSNWLSGFWNGGSGRAYHEGWITDTSTDRHGNYWVISTDQNSRYRSKSKNANNGNFYNDSGAGASRQLSINYGFYTGGSGTTERSYWMVAEVLVYNRTLNDTEITSVENYLSNKYGI